MIPSLRRALIAALVLGLAGPVRAADPPVEATIQDLDAQRMQAMVRGDLDTLRRLLGDDLTYTHASGIFDTKASLLDKIASGRLKYKSIERLDGSVRVYGGVAIATGHAAVQAQSAELGTLVLKLLFTDVWVRQTDGRWQMAAWQSTRMPEPTPAPSAAP
jgi:ketosteroid isomerase-like protein